SAAARGEGGLLDKQILNTNVEGIADIDFAVNESRRVVDENGQTVIQIRLQNNGTKEATHLKLSGQLSENLLATQVAGLDGVQFKKTDHQISFPETDRPPAGKAMTIAIRVQANKPGLAKCRIALNHDDLPEKEQLEESAYFKVIPSGRP